MRQRKEIKLSSYANRSPHCREVDWRRLEIGKNGVQAGKIRRLSVGSRVSKYN